MNLPKRIKPVFKCPPEHKSLFATSHALLTISVGQEVHEGEKFEATIELIDQSFKHITILVDDVLQRHSMSLVSNASDEQLYDHSIQEGDLWLNRNKHLYTQLTTPYNIIRWQQWLFHPEYEEKHAHIKWLYTHNTDFRDCFDLTARTFLDRFKRRQPNLTKTETAAFNCCLEYLFEECAALCLWIEGKFHFEVYPSQRNAAMSITHEKLISPKYPNILLPVSIKFKNRKQLKAQTFEHLTGQDISHVA